MKIDISEKSDNIVVEVEIPPRVKSTDRVVECDYHVVVASLAAKGHSDLICTEGRHLFLSNNIASAPLRGKWTFQEKQAAPAPVASKPPARRKRASKKTNTTS